MPTIPPQIDLSIVVVNWNSCAYLERCLAAVEANTSRVSYEIIVIDSGSFDGCQAMLASRYPAVRFIQSTANLGFGRANTMAAKHARGVAILFLNPDTEVTEGAIERMYAQLTASSDAGVVGCRLLNSDGSVQTSCVQVLPGTFNQLVNVDVIRRWWPAARVYGARALFAGEPVSEVEAVSGACLMVKRDTFYAAGGFSPEYFMYGEDVDLCFKTRRMGLRNYHVADAVVVHHGGGSSRQTVSRFATVLTVDSIHRLVQKSRGRLHGVAYRMGTVSAAFARLVLLGCSSPIALSLGRKDLWLVTAQKWAFILSWALGLERWTAKYNGLHPVPATASVEDLTCAASAEN